MGTDNTEGTRLRALRNDLSLPLIANSVLIIVAGAILWWSYNSFQETISVQTAQQSRFLTMEWNLLQQLKSRTDQQLAEKEREIAALRKQFEALLQQGADNTEIAAIRDELGARQAEREAIIQRRIEIPAAVEEQGTGTERTDTGEPGDVPTSDTVASNLGTAAATAITAGRATPLTMLLQRQVVGLQGQLDVRESTIAALERRLLTTQEEIESLTRQLAVSEEETAELADRFAAAQEQALRRLDVLTEQLETNEAETTALKTRIAASEEAIERAVRRLGQPTQSTTSGSSGSVLTQMNGEETTSGQTTIEMLNTRSLLRAVLTTPEIRQQYPSLLDDTDRYFLSIEERATSEGAEEAYAAASTEIESLARQLGLDLTNENLAPGETFNGYRERMEILLLQAVVVGEP